ncbi:hypothetical protein BOX15_Mlig032911g4 [Macrostomum lignano]|uniref:G-patch domain-containing protein n=1 Tax=Macrostomum lignano TaxID=282301 RepID=A0A267DK62_9PLAT|nr:hypothetical protein BOX15_Mlig032911g4 [Macrostomum lignano]
MPDEAAAPASGSAADRKLCVASGPAYRMMLKQGWTPGSGLGRHGQGRSQPIATVVKRDRLGLGMAAPKSRKSRFRKATIVLPPSLQAPVAKLILSEIFDDI